MACFFWYLINIAFIAFVYWIYKWTDLLSHVKDPLLFFVIVLVIWLAPIIYSVQIWFKKSATIQIMKYIREFKDDYLTKPLFEGLSRTMSFDPIEGISSFFNKNPKP